MACAGIEKRAPTWARTEGQTERGDWVAVIIAWVAVMTMGLAIISVLLCATE